MPLLKADAPLVGTGMERRAALDTGDVVLADDAGEVTYVDAEKIVDRQGASTSSTSSCARTRAR